MYLSIVTAREDEVESIEQNRCAKSIPFTSMAPKAKSQTDFSKTLLKGCHRMYLSIVTARKDAVESNGQKLVFTFPLHLP